MKTLNYFFYFILIYTTSFSQNHINGIVKDKNTQQAIPFASIGIVGTLHSTLSDINGNFNLFIQHLNDADTICVFSIGYINLSITGGDLKKDASNLFYLKPIIYDLTAVVVKPQNLGYKILGTSNYSKDVCTAFVAENNNWNGEQAAIQALNKEGVTVYIESFNFFIIKNEYTDSLQFRIMLYDVGANGYPGNTFLKKPILFKTNVSQGEVQIDLKNYFINTTGDFFISLECLEKKMESNKFCFAGSIKVPSFFKTSAFAKWGRVRGGGGDFNVKVSYVKDK